MSSGKAIVKRGLLSMGHYARRLRTDAFPGVAVLCYHGVRADDWPSGSMVFEGLHVRVSELEAHCRWLRETCHPISLADWRKSLDGGPSLPARSVLLTFDDGYHSIFTLALPILRHYAIPATVFVCSDPVERRGLLWYDAIGRAFGEEEVERIKSLPFDEWQALNEKWSHAVAENDPHAHLTVAEIQALAKVPGIEIGNHTAGHPILARASREEQLEQIARNNARLEGWTGRPVKAFAYPDGRPGQDYTDTSVKLVKDLGFDIAFTTRHGFATPYEPPMERSRFMMVAGLSAAELAHRLCYSWRR